MGTRGFVGFVVDGTEKIAYMQFDAYPTGVGVDVLGWLRGADLDATVDQVRALRVVDPDSTPTTEDIERLRKWARMSVSSKRIDDWYVLLRETQGRPGAMLEAGVIEDAGTFPQDSLFAEWGYLIDFDQQVFEVFEGFQKESHQAGRFADRPHEGDYHPVARVAYWPLAGLPSDEEFLAAFKGDDD